MKTRLETESHAHDAARDVDLMGSSTAGRAAAPGSVSLPSHPVHSMQSSLGNRVTRRAFALGMLQPKLTIGSADDVYEKEADEVAEKVMSQQASGSEASESSSEDDHNNAHRSGGQRTSQDSAQRSILQRVPIRTLQQTLGNRAFGRLLRQNISTSSGPQVSKKCSCGGESKEECAECSKKRLALQRSSAGADSAGLDAPPIVEDVLAAPGQPLAQSARRTLEPGFGHDFSGVRVQDDSRAAQSAAAVNALAYTVGNHIVFGAGRYAPGTRDGNRLLAHELTHTIQQTGGSVLLLSSFRGDEPGKPLGLQAREITPMIDVGGPRAPACSQTLTVARQTPSSPTPSPTPMPGTTPTPGPAPNATSTAPATPTCQPQPLDRAAYLATAGATTGDFGRTTLDLSAVTYPEVKTNPARPSGVVVAPTTAALPTIPSIYTKAGTFVEGEISVFKQDEGQCPTGKYPKRWMITTQNIGVAEQEHCSDFQFAFSISLQQYANAVNALAASNQVFPSQKAAEAALTKTTGVAPANWQTVFQCLAAKTKIRDTSNWHTPRPRIEAPAFPDCKEARLVISDSSLPEDGKHPSSEIVKGCGEKQAPAPPVQRSPNEQVAHSTMPSIKHEDVRSPVPSLVPLVESIKCA